MRVVQGILVHGREKEDPVYLTRVEGRGTPYIGAVGDGINHRNRAEAARVTLNRRSDRFQVPEHAGDYQRALQRYAFVRDIMQ